MSIDDRYIYVDDFIRKVILHSAKILTEQIPYTSFGIISVGIEFLGKCLDEKVEFNFYKSGLPKKHFDLAINELMHKYKNINDKYNLQDKLRNGFLHSFCPKHPLWLRDKKTATELHLAEKDGLVHIIAEELFFDFEAACQEIINRINTRKFKHDKMYRPYLRT